MVCLSPLVDFLQCSNRLGFIEFRSELRRFTGNKSLRFVENAKESVYVYGFSPLLRGNLFIKTLGLSILKTIQILGYKYSKIKRDFLI